MIGKKAWLRIVEAFLAVLIIASVLLVIVSKTPESDKTQNLHEIQRNILRKISLNETLRAEILEKNKTNTEIFINENLPVYFNFTINICEVDEICGMQFYIEKEVYADEILITSNLTRYSPKKLKFFVWMK